MNTASSKEADEDTGYKRDSDDGIERVRYLQLPASDCKCILLLFGVDDAPVECAEIVELCCRRCGRYRSSALQWY